MKNIYLLAFILIAFGVEAQQSTYSKVFKVQGQPVEAYDAVNTLDSGLMIVGQIYGSSGMITRLDSLSNQIWVQSYSETTNQIPFTDIITTHDSCYVVSGHNDYKAFCMKIKENGDTLWTRTFDNIGGAITNVMYAVELNDSNLMFTWGSLQDNAFHLSKMDPLGNVLWAERYEGATASEPRCIYQLADSNIYIGTAMNWNTGVLHKLKADGQMIWSKSYESSQIHDLVAFEDDIFLMGSDMSWSSSGHVTKIDTSGVVEWSNSYSGYYDGSGVHQYVRGYLRSDTTIVFQVPSLMAGSGALMKIDLNGNSYISANVEMGATVVLPASERQTLLVGNGPTYGIKLYEPHFGVIKTDSILQSQCSWEGWNDPINAISPIVSDNPFSNVSPISQSYSTITSFNDLYISYNGCVDFIGSVDENDNQLDVVVYPNVSSGIFNFEFESPRRLSLTVYNVQGQVQLEQELDMTNNAIDLSQHASGVYYYKLLDQKTGLSATGKMILDK